MIKCIAIDDEPLALKQLAYYLERVPFFTLIASCQSAMEAMRVLETEETDVLFIDINMPDLSGLDFVRSLQTPPMGVFTPAYQEYAIDGFRVNAIDYLLKPFGMGDILRAAEKVKRQYDLTHTPTTSQATEDDFMFMRADYKVVRVPLKEILYVEGFGEYLRIYIEAKEKPLVVYLSMKKMEQRLEQLGYMRIHKSYVVGLKYVAEINRSHVVLNNGTNLPIGESYREKLQHYVATKLLGRKN